MSVNDKRMGTYFGGEVLGGPLLPILIINAFFVIKVILQRALKIKVFLA